MLAWFGVFCAGAAMCFIVIAQEPQAQIPPDAEYAGSKLCGLCHKDQKTAFAETPHAKHIAPADTSEPWKHSTGWDRETGKAVEEGIQCEACHGRGKPHVGAKTEEKTALIINPLSLDTPEKINSICAQCHSRYTPKEGEPPVAFTPGDNIFDKIELLPVTEEQVMQQMNEFTTSKHYTEKRMTCIQCHTSHTEGITTQNLRKPVPELCVQCHHEQEDMEAHTKGAARPEDTCITCHMPNGAHTFQGAQTE